MLQSPIAQWSTAGGISLSRIWIFIHLICCWRAEGVFLVHHQHNNQQKASLFFFSLLDSSSTHFVITATTTTTTTTTTTCHHHQQQPQTVPVATPPSTTTNGKLHAHLLSEYYGIYGDTPAPDNRTAAQPQFFLVSLMGHNLYLKWQLDWPTERNCWAMHWRLFSATT